MSLFLPCLDVRYNDQGCSAYQRLIHETGWSAPTRRLSKIRDFIAGYSTIRSTGHYHTLSEPISGQNIMIGFHGTWMKRVRPADRGRLGDLEKKTLFLGMESSTFPCPLLRPLDGTRLDAKDQHRASRWGYTRVPHGHKVRRNLNRNNKVEPPIGQPSLSNASLFARFRASETIGIV
jgi:hypothetical protein